MILSEFLKGRDVKINAVSNYISRNPQLFDGHITREGKNTFLDDEAVRVLDEKYPIPKPTILMNGVPEEEHREVLAKLAKAQELIIMMQNELTDQKLLNAEKDYGMKLLEDKEKKLIEEAELQKKENEQLKERLENLENRTLWDRIRNKK